MFFGIPHKPMSCDMRTLLSCLHHAPNTPSFALFCSYRSHQQRSKRASQTVVLHCNTPCTPFRVFSWTKDTHPPLCRYIREHPSSPDFFLNFFYEFSRLSHVVIFYVYFLIYHVK